MNMSSSFGSGFGSGVGSGVDISSTSLESVADRRSRGAEMKVRAICRGSAWGRIVNQL